MTLLWGNFEKQEIYRITDGNRVVIHSSKKKEPLEVLAEAGLAPDRGDTYRLRQDDSGPVIEIGRVQHITMDYYGEEMEVRSYGETTGQLLTRLELSWQVGDLLGINPETPTYDGMKLRLARVQTREEDYTAVIHCATLRCFDPTLPAGTERLLTEGKNGELRIRGEVTYINGTENSRSVLSEAVAVQPVDGVVAVGTGQNLPVRDMDALPVAKNGMLRLPTGEVLTYSDVIRSLATAYCDKGLTATGTQARVGAIAVDPEVIPYGTRMFIMTLDGEYVYGIATAEDCGSKEHIYDTRIDLHFDTYAECRQFGARWCDVYILS